MGLALPVLWLVAACGSPAPPSTTAAPSQSARASPTAPPTVAVTASPSGTTVPEQVVRVVASATAPTPSGTVVFVMVMNDAVRRGPVTVTAVAASANGRAAVTGSSIIATLAPGATEAAMVRLAIPADDTVGAVTASAVGGPAAVAPNPLTVSAAAFVSDPIQPTVAVTLSTTTPLAAVVLAACYQGSTLVGGGVAATANYAPGAPRVVQLAAAVTQTPTRCVGFARRA